MPLPAKPPKNCAKFGPPGGGQKYDFFVIFTPFFDPFLTSAIGIWGKKVQNLQGGWRTPCFWHVQKSYGFSKAQKTSGIFPVFFTKKSLFLQNPLNLQGFWRAFFQKFHFSFLWSAGRYRGLTICRFLLAAKSNDIGRSFRIHIWWCSMTSQKIVYPPVIPPAQFFIQFQFRNN
jgi:hypothetical protein